MSFLLGKPPKEFDFFLIITRIPSPIGLSLFLCLCRCFHLFVEKNPGINILLILIWYFCFGAITDLVYLLSCGFTVLYFSMLPHSLIISRARLFPSLLELRDHHGLVCFPLLYCRLST